MLLWAGIALPLFPVLLAYLSLVYYLGVSSVQAGILIVWRGCIRYERLSLSPLAAQNVTLTAANGVKLFQAASIAVEPFNNLRATVKITHPHFNFLANRDGLLHLVALLQDVGYLEEAKADPSKDIGTLAAGQERPVDEEEAVKTFSFHTVAFKGALHIPAVHVMFEDGSMDLPADIGQIMGSRLEARLAVGRTNVQRASQVDHHSEEAWWDQYFSEATASYGRIRYPVLLLLNSENIQTRLRGWRVDSGFQLHEPIMTLLHFTPDIAKFTLSKLHPLLGYAATLEGTDHIKTTLTPLGMHLPSEMISLRMEPLRIQLKTKALVKSLISFMNVVGRRDWEEPHTIEAWTSAITADVHRSGMIISKRMDIILGHNVRDGKGFHVCMWGTVNTEKDNAVDMKMGLPATTLRRMGAKEVEDDFVYQILVGGTSQAPEVNFLRAGKDLAEMILKSNIQRGMPFLKQVMRNPSEKRRRKQAADIPAPSLPYPWEAFSKEDLDAESKDVKFE